MKILVLGINYAPEEIGIAVYTTGLCEDLARFGHSVTVVAGNPYYPQWKTFAGFRNLGGTTIENGVTVTRVAHYVPSKPTGAKRLLHHASFALMASWQMMRHALFQKPDIVLTIAPSLISAPVAVLAARIAGAGAWLHLQDLELEAAFATGLLKPGGTVARFGRRFERWTYNRFDVVSAISFEMCGKLRDLQPRGEIVEFRNWAETAGELADDAGRVYREAWVITTPNVALYSGNIGNKQGIEIIVKAARLLAGRTDLTFVVCGEGPNRAALEASAAGLPNIQFHNLQPKERLGQLLSAATVHLLPQLAEAADLVLPSKLTNMLASGRPVVATAASGTGLAREVEGCGIVTQPGSVADFAAAIERLLDDPDLQAQCGRDARVRAAQRWSRVSIVAGVRHRLEQLRRQRHVSRLSVHHGSGTST